MEERFTSGANLNFIVFFACESFHLKHTGDYNTGVIKDAICTYFIYCYKTIFFIKPAKCLAIHVIGTVPYLCSP